MATFSPVAPRYKSLLTGTALDLSQLNHLATGGEGSIYTIGGRPEILLKLYKETNSIRTDKIKAMLATPPAQDRLLPLVAWPIDAVIQANSRDVSGILIPNGRNTMTLLELFTPKLRQKRCPGVDAPFLARVACNLAIAVHQIHLQGHVIGDINESNVLVRTNATILIIDSDSFQIQLGQNLYPCVVGRPEYTPPELHGGAFGKLGRTRVQDYFGLATLIFRLLQNGRHPFDAADQVVNTIEERIKKGRFPHALPPPNSVTPPNDARLSMLPGPLVKMFMAAFVDGHVEPYARPSAMAWATVLKGVEPMLAGIRLR